jgi:hypothetical protein
MEVSGQLHDGEMVPSIHWIRGWVSPRIGLDSVKKRKILPCRESKPGRSARSPSLYRLSYPILSWRRQIEISHKFSFLKVGILMFIPAGGHSVHLQVMRKITIVLISIANKSPRLEPATFWIQICSLYGRQLTYIRIYNRQSRNLELYQNTKLLDPLS